MLSKISIGRGWVACLLLLFGQTIAPAVAGQGVVVTPVKTGVSPPVSELPPAPESAPAEGPIDFLPIPIRPPADAEGQEVPAADSVVQGWAPAGAAPGFLLDFEGLGVSDNPFTLSPPDTNGDVGPNHYVQVTTRPPLAG